MERTESLGDIMTRWTFCNRTVPPHPLTNYECIVELDVEGNQRWETISSGVCDYVGKFRQDLDAARR